MTEAEDLPLPAKLWRPIRCVVQQVTLETADTVTLALAPTEAHDQVLAQQVAPGQFFMVYHFGQGEAPLSVSALEVERGWIEHTIRGNGALTRALTTLRTGDLVGLRGPFGRGWPLTQAAGHDLLLVAGGIGIAPLRAVLQAVQGDRRAYGKVDLVYGARSPQDILFRDDLRNLEGINVHLTVDHCDSSWTGPVGFVTAELDTLTPAPDAVALLCGPEVMMRHVLTQLLEQGLAADRIHLSMERSMNCAIGLCGHCQWGPDFLCRQGPVFPASRIRERLQVSEL